MQNTNLTPTLPNKTISLIVDPDVFFLKRIASDAQSQRCDFVTATNSKEAQEILQNDKLILSGIFINPSSSTPIGIPLIKKSIEQRPNTPIFFIVDPAIKPLPENELKGLLVRKILKKPINVPDLILAIQDSDTQFDSSEALKLSKGNNDKVLTEVIAKDEDFSPILAKYLLAGSRSLFDVYVRLKKDKFVKILQSGDSFSKDRVESYLKKGVVHFYLRKDVQEHYLKFCDSLTQKILSDSTISVDVKTSQLLNHGQETLNFLTTAGLDTKAVQYANGYMKNLELLVNKMQLDKVEGFKSFLLNLANFEHAVSMSIVASLLGKELGYQAETSISIIGSACLFHDIGLQNQDPKFFEEAEEKLSPQELAIYRQHPTKGEEIIKAVTRIPAVVSQVVAQHHERRTRKGFPNKLGSGSITPVAEIIGISEEFVRLIEEAKAKPNVNPLQTMESSKLDDFSAKITRAFTRVFIEKKAQYDN